MRVRDTEHVLVQEHDLVLRFGERLPYHEDKIHGLAVFDRDNLRKLSVLWR
ncbi:MAG: hypothetical protein ACYDCQ_07785 [Dehalococcoidia bacterium]